VGTVVGSFLWTNKFCFLVFVHDMPLSKGLINVLQSRKKEYVIQLIASLNVWGCSFNALLVYAYLFHIITLPICVSLLWRCTKSSEIQLLVLRRLCAQKCPASFFSLNMLPSILLPLCWKKYRKHVFSRLAA